MKYVKINKKEILALKTNIKPSLKPLADEMEKYDSFEEYSKAFTVEIKRGQYWHVTSDPKFKIDLLKGPRDMSSLGSGKMNAGELMVTSDLEYWTDYYKQDGRKFAALIDLSQLPKNSYNQVSRGFGNEFHISKQYLKRVKVIKVYPIKNALTKERRFDNTIPQSKVELKQFWDKVKGE